MLLRLDALDLEQLTADCVAIGVGGCLVGNVELVEFLAIPRRKPRLENIAAGRLEVRLDGPIFARFERLDLGFPVAYQAQSHRLHAPGRFRVWQFAPQHGESVKPTR